MGQKKHHQSSLRTTTLVTTRSRAEKLAARPDKTHGSTESEKRLLPRTQSRPVAEDEIFALPFLHAPTRDHSVYTLSRDEDTHGVPPHRPSASEWATCYGLSKSSTQKWHPQKQDASASTAKVPHLHQEHPADPLPPRAVQLFWSRTGTLRPRCASTLDTASSPTHQFSTSPVPFSKLHISASKSGPNPWCFAHFDFEMCFAPQRRALFRNSTSEPPKVLRTPRALFRHRNFQKWSEVAVFCAFWLPNVLRATTACTFSTSQLPKVVRGCGVLYILTSKCASRHNGVHFFDIATAKSGPIL